MTSYPEPAGRSAGGPVGNYSDNGPLTPPRLVNIAFWLFMLVALLNVVGLILSAIAAPAAAQKAKEQLQNSGTNTHGVDVSGLVGGSIAIAIVLGVLFIVAFVLFAVFMRRGANWARIVLLIITILSLFSLFGGSALGAIEAIAAVVAVVFTYLRTSNEYFRAVKERKLATRGRD